MSESGALGEQEDWGELNTGKGTPRLFVFDIASASVEGVKGTPPESSVGQPVWDPDAAGRTPDQYLLS